MSQSPATVPLGLPAGPPVSPPAKEGAELRAAPAPAPVPDPPRPLRPPPETHLVEAGKLSMGQLAQAHRDRLETGMQVLDIIASLARTTTRSPLDINHARASAVIAGRLRVSGWDGHR